MTTDPPKDVVSTLGAKEYLGNEVVKWSGNLPLPAVGKVVRSRFCYCAGAVPVGTRLTVLGYDVEHGYLYLVCRKPKRLDPKGSRRTIYVAGIDLLSDAEVLAINKGAHRGHTG